MPSGQLLQRTAEGLLLLLPYTHPHVAPPSQGGPPVWIGWGPSQGPSFQVIVSATQVAPFLTLTTPRLEGRWPGVPDHLCLCLPGPRSGPAEHQSRWQTRLQLHGPPAVGVAFQLLGLGVQFQPELRVEGSLIRTTECWFLGSVLMP